MRALRPLHSFWQSFYVRRIHNSSRPRIMPPKKPPLTHFLCLPLITRTSLPQLQSSLSKCKSLAQSNTHSSDPPEHEEGEEEDGENDVHTSPNAHHSSGPTAFIPDKAFRPLGTLHLTLGVMSLKSKEDLDKALKLLEDLDVDSMLREAASQTSSFLQPTSNESTASLPSDQERTPLQLPSSEP